MSAVEHPNQELLASLLAGQLSNAEQERVLAHLEACPDCDRRLDELNPDLQQYRQRCASMEQRLAVRAWPNIQAAMDRFDRQTAAAVTLRSNSFSRGAPRSIYYGALAAAALIGAVLIGAYVFHSELRAQVLLERARKAVPISSVRTRLRVTTPRGTFLRPAVWHAGSGQPAAEDLEAKFSMAHYDWTDPLSPASYSEWRNGLKRRKEHVSVLNNTATGQPKQYAIQTIAEDSPLHEAVLTLDAPTFSATSARFIFADQEWVEVTRVSDAPEEIPTTAPQVAQSAPLAQPVGRAAPEQLVTEREFRVRAAIDQLQAGAGAPIRVDVQPTGEIVVTPYRLSPEQERNLEASLAEIPSVTLRPAGQEADVETKSAARLSGPVDSILNASETVLARTHLLSQLADRFPPSKEEELSLAERKALWEMRVRHARQMGRDIDSLDLLLEANRPASAGKPVRESAAAETQFSITALVETAANVDRIVTSLYTSGPSNADPVSAWPQLTSELRRLRELSRTYQNLAEDRQKELE